jgi:hypothetical protein
VSSYVCTDFAICHPLCRYTKVFTIIVNGISARGFDSETHWTCVEYRGTVFTYCDIASSKILRDLKKIQETEPSSFQNILGSYVRRTVRIVLPRLPPAKKMMPPSCILQARIANVEVVSCRWESQQQPRNNTIRRQVQSMKNGNRKHAHYNHHWLHV